jgi:hypothetical protein
MPSSWILRRVALARTEVSEEHIASIITVGTNGVLGTILAVTTNRNKLRRSTMHVYTCIYVYIHICIVFFRSVPRLLVIVNIFSSRVLVTLKMEAISSSET